MDNFLSVAEMHKLLTKFKASCSEHYGLSDDLACLGENLQSVLQERQNQKAEYLRAVEEKLVLSEFVKQPEEWLTMTVAETQLSESKDILTEVSILSGKTQDRIQEIVDVASDALDTLREKLNILEEKIGKLKEKYIQLNESPTASIESIETLQQSDIMCTAKKLSDLLTSAQTERDIVRGRVKRVEATLNHFEELASLQTRKVATSRRELTLLEEELKELEKLSGIKCRVKNGTSVEIDFLSAGTFPENSGEEYDGSATSDDSRLTVTLTFRENVQKCLELEDVQTNQVIEVAETLIRDAKLDNDLPRLISQLKKMWITHVPLITEISQIRRRHAIDWIPEKGVLLLMPRKSSSVVCALKVPSTYPFTGDIVLESVLGHTSHVTPEDIQPPFSVSLKSWVMHLENLFSQP